MSQQVWFFLYLLKSWNQWQFSGLLFEAPESGSCITNNVSKSMVWMHARMGCYTQNTRIQDALKCRVYNVPWDITNLLLQTTNSNKSATDNSTQPDNTTHMEHTLIQCAFVIHLTNGWCALRKGTFCLLFSLYNANFSISHLLYGWPTFQDLQI